MSAGFEVRQAEDRVQSGRAIAVGIAGVIITVLALFIAHWLAPEATARPHLSRVPLAPREIGILEQPLFDLSARGNDVRREQQRTLGSYGWIDRDAGIARIPIDRAIDLYLEKAR